MDRRLLERTVEQARRTKEFDWKKLPKDLRIAVDSMSLEGASRVEDTINLLAHAARKAMVCVAALIDRSPGFVALSGRAPFLAAEHSIKRAVDAEWSNAEEKAQALRTRAGDHVQARVSVTGSLERRIDRAAGAPMPSFCMNAGFHIDLPGAAAESLSTQ